MNFSFVDDFFHGHNILIVVFFVSFPKRRSNCFFLLLPRVRIFPHAFTVDFKKLGCCLTGIKHPTSFNRQKHSLAFICRAIERIFYKDKRSISRYKSIKISIKSAIIFRLSCSLVAKQQSIIS